MDTEKKEQIDLEFKGQPDCPKCGGQGYKEKKGKKKPCKKCMEATGYCPKCNNTGVKIKNGKPCKCKEKMKAKEEKQKGEAKSDEAPVEEKK